VQVEREEAAVTVVSSSPSQQMPLAEAAMTILCHLVLHA
jgi:hypothetical protein